MLRKLTGIYETAYPYEFWLQLVRSIMLYLSLSLCDRKPILIFLICLSILLRYKVSKIYKMRNTICVKNLGPSRHGGIPSIPRYTAKFFIPPYCTGKSTVPANFLYRHTVKLVKSILSLSRICSEYCLFPEFLLRFSHINWEFLQ